MGDPVFVLEGITAHETSRNAVNAPSVTLLLRCTVILLAALTMSTRACRVLGLVIH